VPAFPGANRGWDTRDNKVIGVRAQPLAELLGSSNDLRADREMHLVELLQAALYFRYVTMNKEDVQRQMSAFRSAKDISLEAACGVEAIRA